MNTKQIVLMGLVTILMQSAKQSGARPENRTIDQSGAACEKTLGLVDQWQEDILELKARYWAGRLRDGASLSVSKPEALITDPELRSAFSRRLGYWTSQKDVPALTPSEVQTFVTQDARSFSLYNRCGRKEA